MEILNISFTRVGIKLTTCHAYSRTLVPLRHDGLYNNIYFYEMLLQNTNKEVVVKPMPMPIEMDLKKDNLMLWQ